MDETSHEARQPAPRVLDPAKNDPAELDRLLVMVEEALDQLQAGWEAAHRPTPIWAQRLASLSRQVRADVAGTAMRGIAGVASSLDEFTDDQTRALWRDGRLPEAEESCMRYGDNLCYHLHRECGWSLNDPERICRLVDAAREALDRAVQEPGGTYIRADELRVLYSRVQREAQRLAAFGAPEWLGDSRSYFDPALDAFLDQEYGSFDRIGSPASRARSATIDLFAYIEGQCGLHLNDRAHLIALLSAAEEALERAAPEDRVPFLVDLYESIRRNLDTAVEGGMALPGPLARALDGFDDDVVSTAIALNWYLRRCQRRPRIE